MKISSRVVIGLLLLATAFGACRKAEPVAESSGKARENILRFDVAAPFLSLNPAEVDVSGSTMIFPLLYSYLFVPDEHGRLQPDLARAWTYDELTYTWTIELRSDAFFHDQRPVTAEDVRHSLQTLLSNIQPALIESIEDIFVLSDHILSIRLNRHDPSFMQKIWAMEIFPGRKSDSKAKDHPIGSGPFAFASRDGERKVVLTANEHYYNGRPALDGVIYYFQPDQEKTWTRLLAETTDIAREISPKNYEITRQYQDQFYFHHYTLEYYSILLYNTRDTLFTDAKVRRALTRAINRQYIVDTILNGYGRITAGPMGVDSPFHDSSLKPLAYDPEAALRELQTAGWTIDAQARLLVKDGQPFAFTLLLPEETQVEKSVARYIQLCFNDIGIQMDVCTRPYKEVVSRYSKNNNFQAILTEFPGAYQQAEYVIKGWLPDEQGRSLAGNFYHPEVTALLYQALRAEDPQVVKKYLFQAEAQIADLQPGSFLFQKTAFDAMSRRFSLIRPFILTHEGIYWLRLAALAP